MERTRKGVLALLIIVLLCSVGVFVVAGNRGDKVQGLLDLGQSYLKDGKYEQAIATFESVLEIDPKEVKSEESQKVLDDQTMVLSMIDDIYEAWADHEIAEKDFEDAIEFLDAGEDKYESDRLNVKLTDVYIAWADEEIEKEDYERAEEILKEGKEKTGDKRFKKKLKKLHKLMYPNGKGASETVVVEGVIYSTFLDENGVEDINAPDPFWDGIRFLNPVTVEIDGEVVEIRQAYLWSSNLEIDKRFLTQIEMKDSDGVLTGSAGPLWNQTLKMRGFFERENDADIDEDYDFCCLEIIE